MTKLGWIAVAGAMTLSVQATNAQAPAKPAAATATEPWKKIPIPPLHDFKPAEPKKIVLANGLMIFLEEDHELPFVNGAIIIRGGSRNEPANKVGLVSLYGQTWRTSGTKASSGDALDNVLAQKAASIETGGGSATTSLHWSSFKQDFPQVFGMAMDLLLHPDFKADKLQLAKRGLTAGIARRNDDASGIAGREASMIAYGKNSPYTRQVEYATVAAVQMADLEAWHTRTLVPNNMIVSVSGDFDSTTMEAALRKAFEPLAAGTAQAPLVTDFKDPQHAVYFVDKQDVNQSNVYIVGLGTERNNPDYYALSVMNEVFSGGFGSRLFQDIRTKQGLAYGVSGAYGASYDHPGVFYAELATKSSTTVAATKSMLAEIELLKSKPPTPEEMKNARDQVLNSFIFNYDSREKTLGEQVTLALYGYPSDYLEKYKAGIEKVTAADVTRVANKYIDVSKLAIVVVGNGSEFGTPLSDLGPVTNLDITIPPPPAPPAKAPKGGPQQ